MRRLMAQPGPARDRAAGLESEPPPKMEGTTAVPSRYAASRGGHAGLPSLRRSVPLRHQDPFSRRGGHAAAPGQPAKSLYCDFGFLTGELIGPEPRAPDEGIPAEAQARQKRPAG